MKELTINVAGMAGSGKTTIATLIQDYLYSIGIDSELNDVDGPMDLTDAVRNLESLKKQEFNVTINTVQIKRSFVGVV